MPIGMSAECLMWLCASTRPDGIALGILDTYRISSSRLVIRLSICAAPCAFFSHHHLLLFVAVPNKEPPNYFTAAAPEQQINNTYVYLLRRSRVRLLGGRIGAFLIMPCRAQRCTDFISPYSSLIIVPLALAHGQRWSHIWVNICKHVEPLIGNQFSYSSQPTGSPTYVRWPTLYRGGGVFRSRQKDCAAYFKARS
jgi:hypothetical protein